MKDFHFFCREFFPAKYKICSQNEYHVSTCVPNSLTFACPYTPLLVWVAADIGLIYFIKAYASLHKF